MDDTPDGAIRILVVEDEAMVALDLTLQLEDEGFRCIGPAPTVARALDLLQAETPDFAVLDGNLAGELPRPVAERLSERGVPFVYVSGYNAAYIVENLPPAPLLTKPIRFGDLLAQIRASLARG